MTAVVTGGSGFLGRNLIRALLAQGRNVRALHRRPEPPFAAPGLTWLRHELSAPMPWDAVLDGATEIYHLSWSTLPQASNLDPAGDAISNIGGSLTLLEALRTRPGPRIVFASSGGTVYGAVPAGRAKESDAKEPLSAYGVSKLAVENYLALYERQWGVRGVSLRLSNPFGPDQELGRNFGVVATFVAQALAGKACTLFGDGSVERDFIYVDDAVAAMIAASGAAGANGVYNIGSGEGRSISDLVAAIGRILGEAVPVVRAEARSVDPPRTVLDASRAAAELGWRPRVSFEDGLARVVATQRAGHAQ